MAKLGSRKKNAKARTVRDRAYDGSPARKKARAARNKARREAIRDGRAKKGDGKDVDHKKPLSKGGSKSKSNTRVICAKKNRSAGGKMNKGRKKK
jgi:5-methylcytosine-specific restriction endonuclease McrA